MPKKDYDKIHRTNMDVYARKIRAVYDSAVKEAAAIGSTVPNFDPSKPFSFSDYPITHNRVKKLSNELQGNLEAVVLNGIDHEWTLSNNKNNELCNRVFGDNVGKLTKEQYRRYYSNNGKAADAFKARKVAGLNLSDRVWKYADKFKTEIEFGIDLDLRDGTSSADMARNLKQYLQNPDKLFRRVRDEHGQLHLSKAAKAFKPGQGVYRSSIKNAQRLARTETNMAYHTADHERWQQFDFVVGVEVRTSNNHPVSDICDTLAGKYPKDFKFVSWHPQCRCSAEPVLKTIEELKGDTERIISGQPTNTESINAINQMPDSFTNWIEDNKGRFGATNTPYFIRDNFKDGKIAEGLLFATGIDKQIVNNIIVPKPLSIQERADIRHGNRTEEQINDIQGRWDERKLEQYCDTNRLKKFDITDEVSFEAQYKSMSDPTLKQWLDASDEVKKTLHDYTYNVYRDINSMCDNPDLANILQREFMPQAAKQMKQMEDFISKTKLQKDMLFKRTTQWDEIEGVFGKDVVSKIKLSKSDIIGSKGVNKRFSSMSFTEQTNFGGWYDDTVDIIYFAPKGTQATYARGFSKAAKDGSDKWEGKIGRFGAIDENEFILNRNYTMRISGAKKLTNGKFQIFIDILKRKQ